MRLSEMAGIKTGSMGARCAFNPTGVGVLRCEKLRLLRAKNGEGWYAEKCCEMTRSGIVSDETIGQRERVEECR